MRDLHTNTKKPIISLVIMALILLSGITAAVITTLDDKKVASNNPATSAPSPKPAVQASTVVTFKAEAGKSVLEQLQQKATVEVKGSSYGPYVESINGLKGGNGGKFWTFYVDGQMANIGAGEYVAKGGEEITWKFE